MDFIKFGPLALFVAAVLKGLVLGFGWVDAPILVILGAIAAFYEFKSSEKKVKLLQARCDAVDIHLTTLYKELDVVKTHFSGLKVAAQMRSTTTLK